MADSAENMIAFLLTDATLVALVDDRIYHNQIDETNPTLPLVWFRRRGFDDLDLMGGQDAGLVPFIEWFDMEAVGGSWGEAKAVADALRAKLSGHQGTFGAGEVCFIRVQDAADDYIPHNQAAEEDAVLPVEALDLEVTNI